MCILFIYRNPNACPNSYRLILASNRDEIKTRPALPAHYWKSHPGCIGGTDMEPGKEGGTWLAMSLAGKAGVILNLNLGPTVTDMPKKGRGSLIPDFLASNTSAAQYLNDLHQENQIHQSYNPYNLILLNLHNADVHYLSSAPKSEGPLLLSEEVLGIGNSELEVPYKKVEKGREIFRSIVNNVKVQQQNELINELFKFLKLEDRFLPDPELCKRCASNYEPLSSIFVSIGEYGTRTHTVVLVNGQNEVTFVEETLTPDYTWKRKSFHANLFSCATVGSAGC